jgi:hypothetical protein
MSQSKETAADMTGAVSAATSGTGLAVATGATANVGVLL